MPQVHTYIPEDLAKRLQEDARASGISTSQMIAHLIRREYGSDWPKGYLERFFGTKTSEPLDRPEQGEYEVREEMYPESRNVKDERRS